MLLSCHNHWCIFQQGGRYWRWLKHTQLIQNKDEEMTSDENLLLIADSTYQTILFTQILQPDQWIF